MTDPQEDKPCRDCKRPTQHATELCDDCRTPAGRLVTALAALGIEAKAEGDEEVTVDGYAVAIDDDGNWNIRDYTGEVDAETAIAAIVQAPELRAERDATQTGIGLLWDALATLLDDIDEALRDACPSYTTPAGSVSRVEAIRDVAEERDTLAAEVKRLTDRLEVFAGALLSLGAT